MSSDTQKAVAQRNDAYVRLRALLEQLPQDIASQIRDTTMQLAGLEFDLGRRSVTESQRGNGGW